MYSSGVIKLRAIFSFIAGICLFLASLNPCLAAKKKIEIDPDKVIVVMIFDDHCMKWCPKVKAVLMQVSQKYGDKIAIHQIDMSEQHLAEAKVKAKKLNFFQKLF